MFYRTLRLKHIFKLKIIHVFYFAHRRRRIPLESPISEPIAVSAVKISDNGRTAKAWIPRSGISRPTLSEVFAGKTESCLKFQQSKNRISERNSYSCSLVILPPSVRKRLKNSCVCLSLANLSVGPEPGGT